MSITTHAMDVMTPRAAGDMSRLLSVMTSVDPRRSASEDGRAAIGTKLAGGLGRRQQKWLEATRPDQRPIDSRRKGRRDGSVDDLGITGDEREIAA